MYELIANEANYRAFSLKWTCFFFFIKAYSVLSVRNFTDIHFTQYNFVMYHNWEIKFTVEEQGYFSLKGIRNFEIKILCCM